jgi:Spy/CpxP family protein refolding chaperone
LELLKMKKFVTAVAILSVISLAGIQTASAHGGRYYSNSNNNSYGYCGTYDTEARNITEKNAEAIEKFRAETGSIRKEIVVKRSELNAILRNENPDETKVAKLTGDLFDLETELEAKAEKTGVRDRYSYNHGPGMMNGYGWDHGRHMMRW